jgi:predicted secreted Zn-dependent protease
MALKFRPEGNIRPTPGLRLHEATLRDLLRNRHRQKLGRTTFSITWKGPEPDAAGRFAWLDVTFTLGIAMPVWKSYPGRPEDEKREWDRLYCALLEHEHGHIAVIKREAKIAYERMRKATKHTINKVHKQETQRIDRAGDAYDRQTDGGRRQTCRQNQPPPGCTPGWPARAGSVGP